MWRHGLWRQQLLGLAIGLIFDIAIALVIADYFSTEYDSALSAFLIVFLGFYVVAMALWLWRTTRAWIVFIFIRRRTAARMAAALLDLGLPKPERHDFSAELYFQNVADNEDLDPKPRIVAAVELMCMRYPAQTGRGMEAWRLGLLYDDALEEMRHL